MGYSPRDPKDLDTSERLSTRAHTLARGIFSYKLQNHIVLILKTETVVFIGIAFYISRLI